MYKNLSVLCLNTLTGALGQIITQSYRHLGELNVLVLSVDAVVNLCNLEELTVLSLEDIEEGECTVEKMILGISMHQVLDLLHLKMENWSKRSFSRYTVKP
jgi:hypothetical protein